MKQQNSPLHHIPDLDIIDLEDDGALNESLNNTDDSLQNISLEEPKDYDTSLEDDMAEIPVKRKLPPFINIHVIFFIVLIALISGIFFSLKNWGVKVDLDEIFKDGQGEYSDTLDSFLPLMNNSGNNPADDGVTNIVCFGNAPFADDRESEDSLANLIAKEADANVYNCSIGASYLAALNPYFDSSVQPLDAYNFYWLVSLAVTKEIDYFFEEAERHLGDATPPEADEVFRTLTTLDFNTVDVVVIMYDASDYLAGHPMYNDANNTDISYFTGNMEAGIELIKANYPHIRIIVLSPAYAFAVDDDGQYVSSDLKTYGGMDVLSTYVIKQSDSAALQSVSFVDNLYGTIHEDNAREYLVDNLHLNVKGRRAVAKRFMEALNFYND